MSSSLGRLALGIVGAVIGSFFGVPAIGFAIGSAIGGFLFAPDGPNTEGPRLGDTEVQASTVGKIIPEHYGTTRAAGNVIWTGGIKEIKKEEENEGGKGGPDPGSNTTYTYFASFAIAFGKGRATDIRKVWADGKIIYDNTGETDTNNGKFNFRFKHGATNTETTDGVPDPLIAESINRRLAGLPDINEGNQQQKTFTTIDQLIGELNGETDSRSQLYANYLTILKNNAEAAPGSPPNYNYTPSYKEICYMVFDNMPLEDFGNRIPNLTAEIVWTTSNIADPNAVVSEVAVAEVSATTGTPAAAMAVDAFSRSVAVISAGSRMRRFSQTLSSETIDKPVDFGLLRSISTFLCTDAQGNFLARGSTPAFGDKIYKLDNTSLNVMNSDAGPVADAAKAASFGTHAGINGSRSLAAVCDNSGNFALCETGGNQITTEYQKLAVGLGGGPMVYGGGLPGETTVFWASQDGTNFRLHKIEMKFGNNVPSSTTGLESGVIGASEGNTYGTVVTYNTMSTIALAGGVLSGVLFDPSTAAVYVIKTNNGGGGTSYRFDPDAAGTAGDPYLQASIGMSYTPPSIDSGISRSGLSGGYLGYASGNDACLVNLFTGEQTLFNNVLSGNATSECQVYDPNNQSLFTFIDGDPVRVLFGRALEGQLSNDLADVIADVCQRVGMEDDEYDVSATAGLYNIRGYSIARPTNGRKVLENLFKAYFIEGIESDWKVKFQPRTSTAVRTIEEWELGSVDGPTGSVPFIESRVQESDLPSEIAMIFSDPNRDYQQGSAHYRRVSQPTPVMYSKKTENIELPIVMDERQARRIAERILFFAWLSRDQGKTKYAWTHIDLDPGDVVEFRFNDGRILTDRIEKADIGANFEIEAMTSRSGDPVQVESEDTNVNLSTIPTNSIITPAYAKTFVLDIPLLYDYHDLARVATRYYVAVGSDSTTFANASIYQSLDGIGYNNIDSVNMDITWGNVTSGALPAPRSLHSIDYDNTITVDLAVDKGDISSTTLGEIVTGEANRFMLVAAGGGLGEIMQFQNATANADGSYTLDTLVRGRRGTDQQVFDHQEGETFLLLTDATTVPQVNTLAGIGTTQYFKGVSRGNAISATPSVGEEFDGNDMKPYAPSYVRRTDDDTDLTVLWNRRTRIGGAWNMNNTGVENVPLNEDNEQYQVFLLPNTPTALDDFDPTNASSFELFRQLEETSTVFTALELVGALYTLEDDINVAVYQLSAQVGRGFGRVVSLAR